jgi:iron complex outermembrane receptor protein
MIVSTAQISPKTRLRERLLQTTLLAVTMVVAAPPHAAQADQPAATTTTTSTGTGTGKLEEVVVTSQKRVQRLQNVPISVAVLGGKDLKAQNIINIDDLGTKIPNVEMVLPFGPEEPQFSIRGVTETDFQPSQSSPIALYVDNDYKSVGALTAMALFDVDQIEIERGPQGTLQGRNATGGSVNIASVKPNTDVYSGYLTAGVGNYGRYETNGAVNIPVIKDILAIRAAFTYTSVAGYIHNAEPDAPYGGNLAGVNDFGGRFSMLYTPNADFNAILRVNYFTSDPVNYGVYPKDIPPAGIGIPAGSLAYLGLPNDIYGPSGYTRAGLGFFDSSSEDVHDRLMTNHSVNLQWDYHITDWLKFTSMTGYDQGEWNTREDDDGTLVNVDEAEYFSKVHSIQQEARFTSSFDGPYNFIFGGLYDSESLFQRVDTLWTGYQPAIVTDPSTGTTYNICFYTAFQTCDLRTQFNQTRTDHAVYFHNSYNITPALQIEAGARYTDDNVSVQHYNGGLSYIDPATGQLVPEIYFLPGSLPYPNPALPLGGGSLSPGNGAPTQIQTDHKWSGKVDVNYKLTPDNMVYASWSQGFRGSAYNGAATFGTKAINAVAPETLIDYEVGSKNQFLDHRLQVNASAFYYIYYNQQFATLNENTGLSEEYNLPKINSEGFELDMQARPVPDVLLRFGGGYTYAVYREGIVGGVSVAGNTVEETPKWSFTTSADWKALETEQGRLNVHVDGNGVTKQYYDAFDSIPGEQKFYTVWNFRLTAENKSGNTAVSFWMQNVFNREYFTSIFNTDSTLGFSFAQRGLPRTFGGQVTYKF